MGGKMFSTFAITGSLSALPLLAGFGLTVYGVIARERRYGLSIALVGLPILGIGLGLMSIALLAVPVP
jgi:hypothetical protein